MKELARTLAELGIPADPAAVAAAAGTVVALAAVLYFFLRGKKPPAERESPEPREAPQPQPAAEPPAEDISSAPPAEPEPPPSEPPPSATEPPAEFAAPSPEPAAPEPALEKAPAPPPPAPEPPPAEAPQEPVSPEEPRPEPEEEPAAREAEPEVPPEDGEQDFFSKLSLGLSKTRRGILQNLEHVFSSGRVDDDTWDEFEEILIMSDMGVSTTAGLREKVSSAVGAGDGGDFGKIRELLEKEILSILKRVEAPVASFSAKPLVFMVAGVNGVGKTTSIGKIAGRFAGDGKKVMVAAADTFRAAAVEQLGVWAGRVGSDFLRGQTGADPSAVAYDAVKASVSRGTDLLIIDTAGRVHTKTGLMDELGKLKRVIGRELEGAPHEILLVVDATTGQNAVEQARVFSEAVGVTGIVLTKLDGTAKGGVIVAIAEQVGLPVKYVGVGEGLRDLREFNAEQFAKALFSPERERLH